MEIGPQYYIEESVDSGLRQNNCQPVHRTGMTQLKRVV